MLSDDFYGMLSLQLCKNVTVGQFRKI